jgi:Leucine-rich repeat (LRR) protein
VLVTRSGYQIAEVEIAKVRREGATMLDLSCMNLLNVPESVSQLTQLKQLYIHSNSLRSLPVFLTNLTNLNVVRVFENRLESLPEWFGQFEQLHSLDFSDNQLTSLPESLGQLIKLKALDFRYNQLKSLPESLGQLSQLEGLHLSNNQITSLPESLTELSRLQSINLSRNQLRSLPESLGQLAKLQNLHLTGNQLVSIPASLGGLTHLSSFDPSNNQLTSLPESLGYLTRLQSLNLSHNQLTSLPESLGNLTELRALDLSRNQLTSLPESLGNLNRLESLNLSSNQLTSLPSSFTKLKHLHNLYLNDNPLSPELEAVYGQGLYALRQYLGDRAEDQVVLNEAKLIIIGEGEVGKSCLLGSMRGDPWVENRETTHGIEILPVLVIDQESGILITLNGWDFGGQRVYRPTHQLFFSAPAVYLVVWKPREGPQQGFVREWITLIKHRAPEAKVLVVATHGGPGQRRPDIDRQEILDLFGIDSVRGFFHVDSKPDKQTGQPIGIDELMDVVARVAAGLPEMGRQVPAKWQRAREALQATGEAYLPHKRVISICGKLGMAEMQAELFIKISHMLGHLIHYHYDTLLRDIVILKPDWLAKAISFILDDETCRRHKGLVDFNHLSNLWSDPQRDKEDRYPTQMHSIFLRLMERFDLSYRVVLEPSRQGLGDTSLIAQLVPDNRPHQLPGWDSTHHEGELQQIQICRIVDTERGQSATAEGLFIQLIVRLHRYSLGRDNYEKSVHWQRGMILDDGYNGRGLLEYVGNDVRITVRAAYPQYFLYELTREVKWLVESFWEGLRCDVMVPCIEPCGLGKQGQGLFEVEKLIESKRQGMKKFPCIVSGCDTWHNIDQLMRNALAVRRAPAESMLAEELNAMRFQLEDIRKQLKVIDDNGLERFRKLDENDRRIMSQVDENFSMLMQMLTDEAKEGPRLFSFIPADPSFFERPKWLEERFRLTLWCEHARQPLPALNDGDQKRGVYEVTLSRKWLAKAAPFLKLVTGTLSLVLPVAASATKLIMDDKTYNGIQNELDLAQKSLDFVLEGIEETAIWADKDNGPDLHDGVVMQAQGAMLRKLHLLLRDKDPGFGGLIRVQNRRREFLWVHPRFVDEY